MTRRFYDVLNRPVAIADNLGHTTRQRYDSRGNLVFVSDAKAVPSSLTLTSLEAANEHTGLPTFAINDHGNTTRYDYDDAGRPIRTTRHMRELGMGGNALLAGGAGSIVTQQTYDKNSRLRTQSDDTGNTTTYSYDALNRLRRTDFADGTSEEVQEFDRNDNVKTRTDANGSSITNGYDANRRLISRSITPASGVLGTTSESYAYDGLGRMVSGSDNDSLITRKHDTLGRVVEETVLDASMTPRTTATVYDGVGSLRSLLYASGRRVQNHFDGFNRLELVENAASMTTVASYKYVGPGRLESRDYPIPGTQLVVSYDGVRRVQGMDHTKVIPGSHIDQRTFAWDRAFNKTSRLNGSSSVLHSYTYDSADQLATSARSGGSPPALSVGYELDGVGNRRELDIDGAPFSYVLNPADPPEDEQMNQYTSTHVDDRVYDNAGNLKQTLVSSQTQAAIGYDYRNQMVEYADFVTGETHTYAYDVLGRRIRKVVDASGTPDVTQYFYQGWRTIEERDGAGTVTATYVYGNGLDEVLNMRRGGNDYFYHQDDLGNVMAITDASGTAIERYDYGDYGAPLDGVTHSPIAGSSIGNPLFFTGARFDEETGLYYMRMRYLDPQVGRFTTRDPIGMWGDPSSRGNGSTYAGSNPWTFIDPMGLSKDDWERRQREARDLEWERLEAHQRVYFPPGFGGKLGWMYAAVAHSMIDMEFDAKDPMKWACASVGDVIEAGRREKRKKDAEQTRKLDPFGPLNPPARTKPDGTPFEVPVRFPIRDLSELEHAEGAPPTHRVRGPTPGVLWSEEIIVRPADNRRLIGEAVVAILSVRGGGRGVAMRPRGRIPGPTIDRATGQRVGRFIVDPKGNTMIEPVGGRTVPAGRGGADTHTLYPNGSNYHRLNPAGHPGNPTPHGHGHLPGVGPGISGQGLSITPLGKVVSWTSPQAHWPIR